MEDHALLAAALEASAAPARTFLVMVAAGSVLYLALLAAVIRELNKMDRDRDKRAASWEREHQEYMVDRRIDARRREVEHARRMRDLDARRR